jgi:PKD repeat protein
MKTVSIRRILITASLSVFALSFAHSEAQLEAQVEVRSVQASDVTPTGFAVVWQVSEAATPAITIFSDAAGTDDITTAFEVILLPFHTGAPALVGDDFAQAEFISGEQEAAAALGVMKIRVEGGLPETTYYYRVDSIAAGETLSFPEGALAAVTTMRENSFLSESRHLLLDLTIEEGLDTSGWLVLARDAAGENPHAISAYVGDGAAEEQVYLNLGRLFGTDGSNWQPIGERDLSLEIFRGWDSGVFEATISLEFTGQFQVSNTDSEPLEVSEPTDLDGDGLDDAWEIENFGDLSRDGTGDFDLDAILDIDEFLEGSNPTEAALPVLPKIVAPLHGERVDSIRPIVEVFLRSGALGNHFTEFEIHAGAELGDIVASAQLPSTGQEAAFWGPSLDLPDDAPYILRARTSNGHGHSEWVEVTFFVSLVDDSPGPFAVSVPRSGETVDTSTPRLEVTNAKDPEDESLTYRFEVFADPAGDELVTISPLTFEGLGGPTAWTVDIPLSVGETYYWRATARDPGGNEAEISLASFSVDPTNESPSSPEIDAPGAEASVVVETTTELRVINAIDPDGDEVIYQFEIDTVSTFDSSDLETSGDLPEGAGMTSWVVNELNDETRYHWRSRVLDAGLVSSAWTVSSFYVNLIDDPPLLPLVQNPGGGAIVFDSEIFLELALAVDPDDELLAYDFEIYSDASLIDLLSTCESESRVWDCPLVLEDQSSYFWRVRARDPSGQTSEWTEAQKLTINTAIPLPPIAIISGASRSAVTGSELTLDASESFDLLGEALAFSWTFIEVPSGSLIDDNSFDDSTSVTPVFTPDEDGTYLVELRVTNEILPDVDRIKIFATALSIPPVADAGPDRLAITGEELTIDGSGSHDPDDGPESLSYLWTFISLPPESALNSASIHDAKTDIARFTPDVDGVYFIRLRVNDGEHSAESQMTVISVSEGGLPPVASAGDDFEVTLGDVALLNGTGTVDPDEGPAPLEFQWRFNSVPAGSVLTSIDIAAADALEASFIPDVTGDYVVELEVQDGEFTVFDTVVVTAVSLPAPRFLRGDVDGSGDLTITDPAANLTYQFLGTYLPTCIDTADYDDSGSIDISDPIGNLTYQFLGGPPPAAPGSKTCGIDTTSDQGLGGDLGCESFEYCEE